VTAMIGSVNGPGNVPRPVLAPGITALGAGYSGSESEGAILRMRAISKDFPGVHALDGVDLDLYPGEVHGLVGENGAGKSTLLKILSGALRCDSGQIFLNGRSIAIADPSAGMRLGITVIYQEFNLVPHLSVARNIYLGHEREVDSRFVLRHSRMNAESRRLLEQLGSSLDPDRPVADLTVAEKQLVEIARALSLDSRIVLMDEPSAPLSDQEVGNLFRTIRALKERGVAIAYVSHRLEELFQITDRLSILRDGRLVAARPTSQFDLNEVIRLMVGRDITEHYPKEHSPAGRLILEVRNAGGSERVPLKVHEGEVVGLAGLVGAGRTELVRSLFGANRQGPERIFYDGRRMRPQDPAGAIRLGLGMVPEDRKDQGLILDMAVCENITLPLIGRLFTGFVIDRRRQRQIAREQVEQLRIQVSSLEQKTQQLSGGNQQKVVLAKWLARRCRLLILDEPTRGIDVGAKYEMYKIMNELTREGKGVLMISSDLPELIAMSDRIYVMRDGCLLDEYPGGTTRQETIIECITEGLSHESG